MPGDLIAGLMLAAIAIPEQLATAKLAGFPVEAGLYAFGAGTIAFAILGANRFASVGADSTVAPIFAGSLGTLAVFGGAAYHGLASALALCVGVVLIVAGVGRAGWIANLVSVPVTTGFLAGISAHIIIGQLPSLLGIEGSAGPLLVRLVHLVTQLGRANLTTCALGGGVLLVTILAGRVSERIPGALIGLIGAGVAVATFGLRAKGVAVLGQLSASFPPLRLPPLPDIAHLTAIAPLTVIVAAVCALQTSIVVRSFPSDSQRPDDVAGDFVALGFGSIIAGFAGAFPVNASPPRTAVAQGAGGRSQLSGLVAVGVLGAIVAFFSPLAAFVPQAALAAVLVFVGMRVFRLRDMVRIARSSSWEINLVIAAALLVVIFPIQTGMLFAIMLSLAHGVTLVMWPQATQLFKERDSSVWWPRTGDRALVDVPGVIAFAPAAPINFTNAEYIRERMLALVTEAATPVTLFIIEASGMTDVDYTGSQKLQATIAELRARGTDVGMARLSDPSAERAAIRTGLYAALGQDHVFDSVEHAVEKLRGLPA